MAEAGLVRGAIGARELLFQAVSFMAPAGSVVFSLALGWRYAGGALALSVLLALVTCLTVAVSIGQMARFLPSAGAFFAYPARALHPAVGFLSAWAYLFAAGVAAGLIALLIGLQLTSILEPAPGAPALALGAACTLLPLVAVYALSVRGISASAKTGTAIGLLETTVIGAISIVLVARHLDGVSVAPFTVSAARAPGFAGLSGIVAGAVYATLAFSGFESAAPLAEEAKNPRATMQRAMVLACVFGAGVFVLTTFAASVALGNGAYATLGVTDSGPGWMALARSAWPPLETVLVFALLSSLVGGQNAAFNALTRTLFAMGRSGVLPAALARTHPRFGSPHVAAGVMLAISLTLASLGLAVGAERVYLVVITVATALMICTYLVANLSCVVFFLREQRADRRLWLHAGVPIAGMLALVPVLCAALGVGSSVLPFVTPLDGPAAWAGPVLATWMALGVVVLGLVAWRRPGALARGGAAWFGGAGPG